jgi:hypothetical protein
MKIKIGIFSFYLYLILFSSHIFAVTLDEKIQKARETEGKAVIKCTPDGKNGGVLPKDAVALLKDGMTLVLMPGSYSSTISIAKNKIILKSEGSGFCDATVKLSGRDCIIKDIYLARFYSNRDIVITDSIISSFSCGSGSTNSGEKIDVYIYNTGLHSFGSQSMNSTIIEMKNCIINGSITCNSKSRISIENSILTSSSNFFSFYNYGNKKGRVALKNNLLFAKSSFGKIKYYAGISKPGSTAVTLKDLKKIWNVVLLGGNILEAPKFLPGNSFFVEPSYITEGKGLIVDEHPFKPVTKKKASVVVKKTVPKPKPVALDDKKKKVDKNIPKKIPTPKPSNKDEDYGFGGIPKPPE